ncbi:arylsulfatase [Novosphingobium resinovorum]|uniref:arylsulfatase n=1 Tax=Novosphingobium resinovorum TaxID=158500 RepID=UPI002ED07FBC|nr:arylsulfatase [Novosphingobium resinovorum]
MSAKLSRLRRWLRNTSVAMLCVLPTTIAAQTSDAPAPDLRPDHWPQIARPAPGAPNILLIMTDDVGFASSATFGGAIPTPNLSALAETGARYNNFNTTGMCSPTRASLLTGRDPHDVEMGNINNLATGYKGYTSVIPRSGGMIAEVLRQRGYATAAIGKWHITPPWELSAYGPFDRWPSHMGFSYFYGFHGGDTDQFRPALFENTVPVTPPQDPAYILDADLADHAISWIRQQKAVAPDHPFFLYLAPGTAHTPHSAPAEWLMKFRGKFDRGWDAMRADNFRRQKALGIIPKDAVLTPRPDFLPAWQSLPAERRQVYARMMEAFAAALAFQDHEVRRVLDSLKQSGELDNTLIVFIQGDNGASAEGGQQGLMAEESVINGYEENFDYIASHIDEIGGPKAHSHFPAAWAWAMNSPFQYYKQVASHFGGTRNGMVVSWKGRIVQPGQIRDQFLFVSDVMPTLLEAAGVTPPTELDGVLQMPLGGVSFASTFAHPKAPSQRDTQVFEVMQNAGIYHQGWMASTRPAAAPWLVTSKSLDVPFEKRTWELYNIGKDFSQSRDLASSQPAKLEELKALFQEQARAHNVLPVHGIGDGAAGRPSLAAGRTHFTYYAHTTRIPENTAPRIVGRSFEIDAQIATRGAADNGVLLAHGGRHGGYALYLDAQGRPTFHYNMINDLQYRIVSPAPMPSGTHVLSARFEIDQPKPASGGTLILSIDGKEVARGRVEHTHRTFISSSEGFDIGEDTLTPVSDGYPEYDNAFRGEIKRVDVELR